MVKVWVEAEEVRLNIEPVTVVAKVCVAPVSPLSEVMAEVKYPADA
jgi:hypothetical protein